MTAKSHRLFFALWPTDALRLAVDLAARPLLAGHDAREIPAENFHVTLAFLGSVRDTLLAPIKAAAAAVRCPPFELRLDRVESWKRAELLCVAVSTVPSELVLLVERLRSKLAELRFEADGQDARMVRSHGREGAPDHKEFKPHLTLAREWHGPRIEQAFGSLLWPARDFVLVESHTEPRGSRYEVLERWPLRSDRA